MDLLRYLCRGLLPVVLILACHAGGDDLPTLETIRERMEAIGIRSVRSSDGQLVVSGADSFMNAMLLAQAGEIRQRVQAVVGMPLQFDTRSVRVLVKPDADAAMPIVLEHVFSGGQWIHRIVFPDYASSQAREGLEAVSAAFLALYIHPGSADTNRVVSFTVPAWLSQGVQQVLTDGDRSRTLDQALQFWHEGRLPSPVQMLTARPSPATGDDDASRLLVAHGAFVLWLADRNTGEPSIADLFRHLSAGHAVNTEWLRQQLPEGVDPDASWDRWLLSQRHVVRSLGQLSLAHMETLRDEWLVQPGDQGIPADLELPAEANCVSLLQYRDQSWLPAVIRQKRYRLEMLAQGRPERFRELVSLYVNVLNAIESGERPPAVVGLAVNARRQWHALHETVKEAGGIWSEP